MITRNIMGTSGNVFERLRAREGLPSALFENLQNLASSSHELRPDISGNTLVPEREIKRRTAAFRKYLYNAEDFCETSY